MFVGTIYAEEPARNCLAGFRLRLTSFFARVGELCFSWAMDISRRDFFAGQALIGILASPHGEGKDLPPYTLAAEQAFAYADAMVKAAEKKKEDTTEIKKLWT